MNKVATDASILVFNVSWDRPHEWIESYSTTLYKHLKHCINQENTQARDIAEQELNRSMDPDDDEGLMVMSGSQSAPAFYHTFPGSSLHTTPNSIPFPLPFHISPPVSQPVTPNMLPPPSRSVTPLSSESTMAQFITPVYHSGAIYQSQGSNMGTSGSK